jgi:hypothetical protein
VVGPVGRPPHHSAVAGLAGVTGQHVRRVLLVALLPLQLTRR